MQALQILDTAYTQSRLVWQHITTQRLDYRVRQLVTSGQRQSLQLQTTELGEAVVGEVLTISEAEHVEVRTKLRYDLQAVVFDSLGLQIESLDLPAVRGQQRLQGLTDERTKHAYASKSFPGNETRCRKFYSHGQLVSSLTEAQVEVIFVSDGIRFLSLEDPSDSAGSYKFLKGKKREYSPHRIIGKLLKFHLSGLWVCWTVDWHHGRHMPSARDS